MTPSKLHRTTDSPLPDVLFIPFSEGCVLFQHGTRRIWALNRTAAFFWCLLDEVGTVEDLAQRAAESYGIAYETALEDARTITDFFIQEGLLGNSTPLNEEVQETGNLVSSGIPVIDPDQSAIRHYFNLPADHILEVACLENVSASLFFNLMAHLRCGAPSKLNDKSDVKPDSRLWVIPGDKDDLWNIALNAELSFENLAPDEILPHLFLLTFSLATDAPSPVQLKYAISYISHGNLNRIFMYRHFFS